jgi:hypothetical protein
MMVLIFAISQNSLANGTNGTVSLFDLSCMVKVAVN